MPKEKIEDLCPSPLKGPLAADYLKKSKLQHKNSMYIHGEWKEHEDYILKLHVLRSSTYLGDDHLILMGGGGGLELFANKYSDLENAENK